MTIWKYAVPVEDMFTQAMPRGAKVLAVQVQNDDPQMWALVNEDEPPCERVFRVVGTGYPVEMGLEYVGTFQLYGGRLVFHLFESIWSDKEV